MEVLVTLKINDKKGKLLRSVQGVFIDETGAATLDELIEQCGEDIQCYLMSLTEFGKRDCGKAIVMRFHYVALSDEEDAPDSEDELTADNERIILRYGHICAENELVNYIVG